MQRAANRTQNFAHDTPLESNDLEDLLIRHTQMNGRRMPCAPTINEEHRMRHLLAAVDRMREVDAGSRNADTACAVKQNYRHDDTSAFDPSEDVDACDKENCCTTNVKCVTVVATSRKKHRVKHRPCQKKREQKWKGHVREQRRSGN